MGGSAGVSPEAIGARKRVAEARREQLALHGLAHCFRGYRDPDVTFHAWAGVRQHSVARVSVMGIALSTAAGNPRPILSRIAWGRCDFHLVAHSAVSCHRVTDVAGVVERVSWV